MIKRIGCENDTSNEPGAILSREWRIDLLRITSLHNSTDRHKGLLVFLVVCVINLFSVRDLPLLLLDIQPIFTECLILAFFFSEISSVSASKIERF